MRADKAGRGMWPTLKVTTRWGSEFLLLIRDRCAHTHTHTHKGVHVHAHTHTHTHKGAHRHTHTHKCVHAHIHTAYTNM